MTILELKIDHCGSDCGEMRKEHGLCQATLTTLFWSSVDSHSKVAKYHASLESLRKVNHRLWYLVDDIHALYHGDLTQAGRVAVLIAQENDRRAELVGEINALLGYATERKFYAEAEAKA